MVQMEQADQANMEEQATMKCTHNGTQDFSETDFEEVKIPVPWGFVAGKWWGSKNKQPIIAIHGWQDNAGTFDRLAPQMAKYGLSVLCIDLPGHGFSTHHPKGMYYYIFWDGVHLLRRIVKHYKWSKISILGHSLGACIAFLYASIYPEEVESYVSVDIASPAVRDISASYGKLADQIDKFLKYETLTEEQMPHYGYEEMIGIVFDAYGGSCTRESCEIMMRRGMQFDGSTYHFSRDPRLKAIGMALIDIEQALEMSRRIRCRVLNLRGNPGMKLDRPEWYDMILVELEKNCAYLERHVVEGTHHLHLNDPDKITQIVVEFLTKQ